MEVSFENFKSGWKREWDEETRPHPDFQSLKPILSSTVGSVSVSSDMRNFSPFFMRQHQWRTSTCVAQSVVRALEIKRVIKFFDSAKARGESDSTALQSALQNHVDLSRLALYFMARNLMSPSQTNVDEGTYISLAADALARFGVCKEKEWPWDEKMIFVSPDWVAMRDAFVHKIKEWNKIYSSGNDRVDDAILSLSVGNPVVFGTAVGDNWSSYDGSKPLELIDGPIRGHHATALIGWDANKCVFIGENSWGTGWGVEGFYEMRPEVIASSDSSDFVTFYGGWESFLEKI